MVNISSEYFDPAWQDDVFDRQALDIPLYLPEKTPKNDKSWIEKRFVPEETIFEKLYTYEEGRIETAVVKPSDMPGYFQICNQKGDILPSSHPVFSFLFPPKSWMSDNGEERCMMLAPAKTAKGHVLVGGLGLGIYPQFVLALKRPVESITIIESNHDIIEIVTEAWLKKDPPAREKVTIIEGTIEEYLQNTNSFFDTIYLDTWEDADPRFLAHINYLIDLAHLRCSPSGNIKCWGYAKMVEVFAEDVKNLTRKSFPFNEYHLDPVLQAYYDWLSSRNDEITDDMIIHNARECALTTKKSISEYDRHRCFTGYGRTLHDAYRNSELSMKEE